MYTRRERLETTFSETLTISVLFIKWRGGGGKATRYSGGILFSAGNKKREGGGGGGWQLSGNGCSPTFYLKQYPARTAKISAIREFRDEFLLSKTSTSSR